VIGNLPRHGKKRKAQLNNKMIREKISELQSRLIS
jgi:hypothetical protein